MVAHGADRIAIRYGEQTLTYVPDERLGQRIAAWVQLHRGAAVDAAERAQAADPDVALPA